MSGLALPLVGMSAGAAIMVLGSSQLTAAWLGPSDEASRKARFRIGMTGALLVGIGTALEVASSFELERRRR